LLFTDLVPIDALILLQRPPSFSHFGLYVLHGYPVLLFLEEGLEFFEFLLVSLVSLFDLGRLGFYVLQFVIHYLKQAL
jgi:hypothetical protein